MEYLNRGMHPQTELQAVPTVFFSDRVLPEKERELLRLYFGIGRRRHSMDELIALFDSERKVNTLLQSAMERLRYSDEILAIYKYLHR